MTLDEAVSAVLARHMPRVQVRPGNGLSANMNQTIRSYPDLPEIIRRTVGFLASTESLFNYSGAVRVHCMDVYKSLLALHDDWVREVPSTHGGNLMFRRVPKLPYHQFSSAWSIARRIGLIEGRGDIGLSKAVLAELRRLLAPADQLA